MYKYPQTPDEIKAHIEVLTQMVRAGGWELMDSYLASLIDKLQADMFAAPDAHQMAVLSGRLSSLVAFRNWPMSQIKRLQGNLADLKQMQQQPNL